MQGDGIIHLKNRKRDIFNRKFARARGTQNSQKETKERRITSYLSNISKQAALPL